MPVRSGAIAVLAVMLTAGLWAVGAGIARAEGPGDAAAVKQEEGKYFDRQGNATYKVQGDGTVDWYTYSGFRRYHSECHVCHGPDGEGSTYAPALSASLRALDYGAFANAVINGRKNVGTAQDSVMPSFGTNRNVMCYLEDLYVYLRARADNAVPRGRPAKHEDKPAAATQAENGCLGHN